MENKSTYKHYSYDEALIALQKYCAYQDRCHQEVRFKLLSLKIYGDDLENIIVELIKEKFLDEERYARSFVRGKYKLKKWGRIKILQALKQKQISSYCLKKGMEEISEEIYLRNLDNLISTKEKDYHKQSGYIKDQKIIKFLLNKGYEYDIIKLQMNKS